jgi:hypothetical protein
MNKNQNFDITIGEDGLDATWQAPFPETTKCTDCGGESRIGFVVFESPNGEMKSDTPEKFVSELHKNDPDGTGYWLHDCCAVAVYFCKKCLNPTALYNQG